MMRNSKCVFNEYVGIRAVIEGDSCSIQEYASDKRVSVSCNIPYPYPDNGGEEFVKRALNANSEINLSRRIVNSILYKGSFAGIVSLNCIDLNKKTAELDYWVAYPFWGKGIASEAGRQMIEYGSLKFGIKTFFSGCLEDNTASARVLEKAGFKQIGIVNNKGMYGKKFIGRKIRRFCLKTATFDTDGGRSWI